MHHQVHMGICTFFCFFGLLALLVERIDVSCAGSSQAGGAVGGLGSGAACAVELGGGGAASGSGAASGALGGGPPRSRSPSPSARAAAAAAAAREQLSPGRVPWRVLVLVGSLLVQAFSSTVVSNGVAAGRTLRNTLILAAAFCCLFKVTVLWPLYLRDRFGFDASDYGAAAFAASLAGTSAVRAAPPNGSRYEWHHEARLLYLPICNELLRIPGSTFPPLPPPVKRQRLPC